MRGIGSDGLSFEFVAPAVIKMAAGLSCLSLFRVIFFVTFLSCYMRASLPLSVQAVKQESVLACKFQFLLSENKRKKKLTKNLQNCA
jgi:hypothetical protein